MKYKTFSTGAMFILIMMSLNACWSYISQEAQDKFQNREGLFTVSVYPVRVVKGESAEYDVRLANEIGEFLKRHEFAYAIVKDEPLDIPVIWGHNQAKMAKRTAEGFADHIKGSNLDTEYALLVELLCDPGETYVGGIHFFLTDKNGLLASGGLTNSHWDEYKAIMPTDRNGGIEVLKLMLKNAWVNNK